MEQKKLRHIFQAPTDILGSVTRQVSAQVKSATESHIPKQPDPEPPKQTQSAQSGIETAKPPTYATPTAINRSDAQVTAPKPPSPPKVEPITPQAPRTLQRDDAAVRRNFAARHPEYTGGLEGERTRAANTAVVMAQAGVNEAQTRYDAATKQAATPASSYLTGGVATPSLPYAAGEQGRQTREAVKRSEPYAQVARRFGELFDAKELLGYAQTQKAKLERERELLAPVSTQAWDQRIRDQYATADKDGRVSETEVHAQKIKAAKGMALVEQEKAGAELERAQAELMACNISDLAARQGQGPVPYEELPEYRRQKQAAYDKAKAKHDAWTKRVNELSRMDHTARNESAFGRLAADEAASATYQDTAMTVEDREKLHDLLRFYSNPDSGWTAQQVETMLGYEEELGKRYGLTHQDLLDYAAGGDVPETILGADETMAKRVEKGSEALAEKKYDFRDTYGYEKRVQKQQEAAKQAEADAQFAREHPAIGTAATVGAALFQVLDVLNFDPGKGKPGDVGYIPPDSSDMTLVNAIQTVRGTVSHDLARSTDWELFGQNVPAFLYNTGMSMADSAVAIATFGAGSVYLMGMNAAVNTAKEVVDNGGTTQQALKLGIAAGVAEVLFEKFSVENLLKPRTPQGWRDVVDQYVVQQGLVELSEEACTEIANILAEVSILGADSDYAKAVEGYRDQGLGESDAKQKAFLDMLGRVGWSGAGGFISGAGMGGGKAAVDYASQSGAQSLSNAGKALIETIQSIGADQQKTASTGEAGSTVIDTGPTTHTPEQQAVINEYQAATDKGILAFVERWRGLKDPNYRKKVRMDIASVNQRTAQDVKAAVGVDVSDFTSHSLSGNALEHIEIRHGESGKADHSMADPNDIARMGYVLEHYDSVEALVDKNGNPVLSREYYNADGSHAAVVRFSKRVDGTYYVVEAVPDSAAKEFRVISAYMEKGSDGTSRELGVPQSDPQPTSKTGLNARAITSDSSITEASTAVKPEGDGGVGHRPIDASAHTAATAALTTLLQKVKSTAEEMVERPEGLPESILKQFQPLWEKQLTAAKCKVLGDLLGFTPEFQKTIEPLLAKTLADAEDIARWESLDRSTQVWQHLQPMYQEKKASIQWLENILQKMEGRNGEQKQAAESDVGQESELENKARHVAKGILSMGRPTGFEGLPQNLRHSFNEGLKTASPEIQVVLRQWKRKVQYITSAGKRSFYRAEKQMVSIGRNSTPSTVAHELFHWADDGRRISSQLLEPLMQDYIALKIASGEDIKAYLMERYPGAFIADDVLQDSFTMRPEFRGIADILNGLSGGKERYGYGHSKQYWAKEGALEAEAWAQFGRHQYDNLNVVLKMFQELFPNFYESAMIKLKELM